MESKVTSKLIKLSLILNLQKLVKPTSYHFLRQYNSQFLKTKLLKLPYKCMTSFCIKRIGTTYYG